MIDKNRLTQEFCELVSIDAPSYKERQMADALTKKLLDLGFTVTEDDAASKIGGNAGSLYGFLKGTLEGPPLLFSSHMDTVPPAYGKVPLVSPEGKITSKGGTVLGADDVTGLVAILEAVRSLIEDKAPRRDIEVLFPVAEEVFTIGCEVFDTSQLKAKEAYILDLSGDPGRAAYRAPSIITFKAEFVGKAAHAGFAPEEGIHSIQIAARAISKIPLGRVGNGLTVNIGTIIGGEAVNIIPENCGFRGEVRGFDHQNSLAKVQEIHGLLEAEATAAGASLIWEEQVNCVAYNMDPEGITAIRYREACAKIGIEAEFVETFGGSDFNTLATKGFVGLVLSNAMYEIHSTNEYTLVDELYKSTQIVEELMKSELF